MPESLQLSFEYSYEDLKESIRQHLRSPIKRWSRIVGGWLCALSWLALGCLVLLLHYAPVGTVGITEAALMSIALMLLSVVIAVQYPWLNALYVKKRYRHMYGERQDWRFTREGYGTRVGERAQGTSDWSGLTRMVRTSTGVLLYHANGVFNWLPHRGFGSDADIDALADMARTNKLKIVVRN